MKNPAATIGDPPIDAAGMVGKKIGHYRIVQVIKAGGMGIVYLAEQEEPIRRKVALKVIKVGLNANDSVARFNAERQALALMDHPNVAKVLEADATPEGQPYFVMEFVQGVWLTDYCDENNLSISERLQLFIKVCRGVQHAHTRGIIHRDIKPSNILVTLEDGVPTPKVIDFGIAKATQEGLPNMKPSGTTLYGIGTPDYMSPEQVMGKRDIDTRSDVYSLGVLLHEILIGIRPFHKEEMESDVFYQYVVSKEPTAPSKRLTLMEASRQSYISAHRITSTPKLAGLLRDDLDSIVLRALKKSREERYETVSSLVADIESHLRHDPVRAVIEGYLRHDPVRAVRQTRWYIVRKFVRKERVVLSFALLVILLFIGIPTAILKGQNLRMQRDMARRATLIHDAFHAAELSAEFGRAEETLVNLKEAEKLGFNDFAELGLMRVEALTALNRPDDAEAELQKLSQMGRTKLGKRYGEVEIRQSEHELFDETTVENGLQHLREAATNDLKQEDLLFVTGLLTNSITGALKSFERALQNNPRSHAAHVHSLGMQFILGRHADLAEHVRLFSALYPDDPSGCYLEGIEFAFAGRTNDAAEALAPLRKSMNAEALDQLTQGYCKAADAAKCFDVETVIKNGGVNPKFREQMAQAGRLIASVFTNTNGMRLREPHLPSVQKGLLDGVAAVEAISDQRNTLDVTKPLQKLNESFELCPESFLPFEAAVFLQTRQPRSGSTVPIKEVQSDLFQKAADTSCFLPGIPRSARYLAAKVQLELIELHSSNEPHWRENCLHNIRLASESNPSVDECRAYFPIALELHDYDSARNILHSWQLGTPDDLVLLKRHVELEMLAGNFREAFRFIQDAKLHDPNNSWTAEFQQDVVTQLQDLLHHLTLQTNPN